jgi:hypothetical protein
LATLPYLKPFGRNSSVGRGFEFKVTQAKWPSQAIEAEAKKERKELEWI